MRTRGEKVVIEARGVHDDEVLSFMVRLFSRRNMDSAPDGVVAELRHRAGDKAAWYSFYPRSPAPPALPAGIGAEALRPGISSAAPTPKRTRRPIYPGAAYIRSCRALAASEYFEDQVAGLKGSGASRRRARARVAGLPRHRPRLSTAHLNLRAPRCSGLLRGSSRRRVAWGRGVRGCAAAREAQQAHENVLLRKRASLEARLVKADMAKIEAALKR